MRLNHISFLYFTELSHVGKLREVREVRGKLRDKCPNFKLEDYCLFTSRTTVGSDNFFNFNQFPHLRNLNILYIYLFSKFFFELV